MITFDSLNAMWAGQRNADSPVRLMGFRGALEAPGQINSLGGDYDDLMALLLDGRVTYWRVSVDPAAYFVKNPCDPAGCAQLRPGNHLFSRHLLHGKYKAFMQAEPVHVNRLDAAGDVRSVECGDFAICLHSGGGIVGNVGRTSEGCQVYYNPAGYQEEPYVSRFYDPIDAALTAAGVTTFSYLLQEMTGLGDGITLENAA